MRTQSFVLARSTGGTKPGVVGWAFELLFQRGLEEFVAYCFIIGRENLTPKRRRRNDLQFPETIMQPFKGLQ